MDREKLKLIVKNLKLLVDSLESEVNSDTEAYKYETYQQISSPIDDDYDEIFDGDE